MHVGPDSLIVAARVALSDDSSADQVEDLADDIDHRLSERLPVTPYVFIDPTQTASGEDGISPARQAAVRGAAGRGDRQQPRT
jgi:hypothetical protein